VVPGLDGTGATRAEEVLMREESFSIFSNRSVVGDKTSESSTSGVGVADERELGSSLFVVWFEGTSIIVTDV